METKNERTKGRVLIILTALLWGLAGVCVKSISWNAFSQVAARGSISLIMLFCAKKSFHLKWNRFNITGGAMAMIASLLYVAAIKLTTAGTAIVLQYIAPIFVYLYGVIFKKNKVRLWEMLIVFAVFVGCVLSFSDDLDSSHLLGNIFALLSGVTYAAEIVILNDEKSDSGDAMIINNIFSVILCIPFMFFDTGLVFDMKNIIWVVILGVFQYGLANICFTRGIQHVDAVEASLLLTIEPVFNPIPVMIFCNETMGTKAIIGSVIVIVFVTLYGIASKRSEKTE